MYIVEKKLEAPCELNTDLLYQMLRIRRVEEAIAARYHEQEMRCPTHLCIGQEAIAVGVSNHLSSEDKVYSNHRAHGHYLAKGGDLNQLIAELYGKNNGCCGGRGGSMHLTDLASGFVAATPIVGGTIPIAAGHAWSMQLRSSQNIVVVYFGDGCFEEGVMHETLNFAALKKLPILFVCENNEYAVMTSMAERQPDREIYKLAQAHGINAHCGDGNDVQQVDQLAAAAIKKIRQGHGPQFVEFFTHRWPEHCGPNDDDELGYREPGELEAWKAKCPIDLFQKRLENENSLNLAEVSEFELNIEQEIKAAFDFALSGSEGGVDISRFIYAD
ncbi:MAG: thiamine pyrophosphate-dependent dehydrogenase E1 component subunit alpha [Gammaproteobacteria bacterium]|nr:thiamine pyrophosphate-dependent dehydrogenase E1 component subunit alpha [Gammaproteobacteria bacterium]